MKKKLVGIIAVIVIVLAGAVFYFTKQAQDKSSQVAEPTTSQKKSASVLKKKSSASSSSKVEKKNQREDSFSTDEWMLMGYMAYARKNHDNEATSKLVDEIAKELSDGDLKAVKNSDSTYTLSNQYGSVDVTVKDSQVKVTNDGTTVNSKSDLKKTFSSYQNKISQMAQSIGKSNKKSTAGNVDFDTKELAVLAYVESHRGSAADNIKQTEQEVNRGYQASEDADYVSGLYKNDGKYGIAFNHSTSQYNEYKIVGDSLQTIVSGGGVQSNGSKYSIKELSKKYAPYKNEIDEILTRLEYNKKNLSKVNEQINKQAEESLEDNDND